jgi:hypothetical protein
MEPEKSEGYFGGGNKMLDRNLKPILTANLTMDEETGLGVWTKEGFIKTVRFAVRLDGTPLRFPMRPYTYLTDEEIGAIWAYLQTLPKIHNANDRTPVRN